MNLNEMLFWTERDDLENDETSSKDPLGTEAFAAQLADLILPGLTSLTRRIRYVTLICLWLKYIEKELQEENVEKIIEYIKNFEKLAAFCIIRVYRDDKDRTESLQGKRYAKAYFDKNIPYFSLDSRTYPFLVNHGSAGAFAFYKVLLKALGYIQNDNEFSLTPDGIDLIEGLQIPHITFIKNILQGKKENSSSKKFDTLGEFFGLSNFKALEKTRLRSALFSNDIRRTAFMLIKKHKQDSEFDTLSNISKVKISNEVEKYVATICDYIIKFEMLNREIHYVFYSLMNIDANQISIDDFIKNINMQKCLKKITGAILDDYLEFHANHEQWLKQYDDRPYQFFNV